MTRAASTGSAVLVHLGDYIDFGPDSAGVFALLAAGPTGCRAADDQFDGRSRAHGVGCADGDDAAATDWLHMGGAGRVAQLGHGADVPRSEWRAMVPA